MRGFDDKYRELPDYILKCTHQIWESRDSAAIEWTVYDEVSIWKQILLTQLKETTL